MSARDKILSYLWMAVPSSDDEEAKALASKMIDDLLHEEAEKIRASRLETPEGFTHRESWVNAWNSGRDDSADLIDPYAK